MNNKFQNIIYWDTTSTGAAPPPPPTSSSSTSTKQAIKQSASQSNKQTVIHWTLNRTKPLNFTSHMLCTHCTHIKRIKIPMNIVYTTTVWITLFRLGWKNIERKKTITSTFCRPHQSCSSTKKRNHTHSLLARSVFDSRQVNDKMWIYWVNHPRQNIRNHHHRRHCCYYY